MRVAQAGGFALEAHLHSPGIQSSEQRQSSLYFRVPSHAGVLARSLYLAVAGKAGPSPFRLVFGPNVCGPLRALVYYSKYDTSQCSGHPWWWGPSREAVAPEAQFSGAACPHPGDCKHEVPPCGSENPTKPPAPRMEKSPPLLLLLQLLPLVSRAPLPQMLFF